jgi:hypothetical protein
MLLIASNGITGCLPQSWRARVQFCLNNGCPYRIFVVLLFLNADTEIVNITDHNHDFVRRGGNQKVCL